MDLCGPVRIQSRGGKKYIMVIVDDFSRFTWNMFLRTKDETTGLLITFANEIQLKVLIRSVIKKTPYELLNNMKPLIAHMKPFGCKCFVLNNGNDDLGKFNAKSDEGLFVGYSSTSKAYIVSKEGKGAELTEELGLFGAAHKGDSQNKEHEEDESAVDIEKEITRKSGWKHQSSNPLDNLVSPLDSRIQTRSKTRNLVAYSAFISNIEPNNIKEALKDADWVTSMQEELHQFERNNV
ncbi:hypothetical protein KY285_020507 [Solanum tuberosum]|nr:hypothetical protein KY285_020507 [Solanum tuberosum]